MLCLRNLKIRYKHSALGFFWSLLTPGLLILIYALFAKILRFSGSRPHYLLFLVCGIVIWQFTVSCLNDGLNAVTGSSNLVKKTRFPRLALPVSLTLANTVNFLLTALVLIVFLVISRAQAGPLLYLLPALAGQLLLCLGIVMLVSAGNVYFRDLQHIVGVVSLAWFFLSPIFYDLEMQTALLPEGLAFLCYLNPMSGLLGSYRSALLADPPPPAAGLAISLAVCLAVFLLGERVFARAQRGFGDVL